MVVISVIFVLPRDASGGTGELNILTATVYTSNLRYLLHTYCIKSMVVSNTVLTSLYKYSSSSFQVEMGKISWNFQETPSMLSIKTVSRSI